jgi:hypothetical protein
MSHTKNLSVEKEEVTGFTMSHHFFGSFKKVSSYPAMGVTFEFLSTQDQAIQRFKKLLFSM